MPLSDAILWLEPSQARFAHRLAERAGWRIAAAGFPKASARADPATDAAAHLGIDAPFTDLRHALATTDARLLVVLSPLPDEGEKPGALSPLDDPQLIDTCRSRDIDLLTLEPVPGALINLPWQTEPQAPGPLLRQTPLFRRSTVFAQARELLPLIGTARAIWASFCSPPGHGTLAARLVDACAALEALPAGSLPDTVDATLAPTHARGAVHLAPPERLRHLRGDLTANLRLNSGAAASIALCDHAGPWHRRLRVVGDQATIELSDNTLTITDPQGNSLESAPAPKQPAPAIDAVEITASQARAELERRTVPEPINWPAVLSLAEAALLSARTGQNESPATLLRMAGVPA